MATSKRGTGEGGIRRRADGSWEGRVRRPDGRRHSVYGRTRAETARKLAVAIRDRDSHAPPSATMTLAAFLTRWLREDATPRLRPRTAERYALDVKRASKAILRG